jgi:hypothetical protein
MNPRWNVILPDGKYLKEDFDTADEAANVLLKANCGPRHLDQPFERHWSPVRPIRMGYYWWRRNRFKTDSIYYVFFAEGIWWARWCNEGLYDRQPLESICGEWDGPIQPPVEHE